MTPSSLPTPSPGGIPPAVRLEYPRPQFVRPEWLNLNGEWEFAFDDQETGRTLGWHDEGHELDGRIVVPFAYQYELSGIGDRSIHEVVWYARTFDVPKSWIGRDLLLHFGAVDYEAFVWINGRQVGRNQGGHVPFSFDISPYVRYDASNRVTLQVIDRQSKEQPRGKQSVDGLPKSCDYYCTTGIWQTVWIEPVPQMRIADLQIHPRVSTDPAQTADGLDVRVYLHAPALAWTVMIDVFDDGIPAAQVVQVFYGAGADLRIDLPDAKRWSPGHPHLYDLRVRLMQGERVVDEVASYAGIRNVTLGTEGLYINGERVYQTLALDQGYWPDGGMTAPSDDALRADVEWALQFGFNGVRKHQKVEDPRWLYWCDRLGLMVWGEMANARAWSLDAEEHFLREWERAVRRDYNHPCIVVWVPLNESWGVPGLRKQEPTQYEFVERIVSVTRRLDLTRPVIDNDGWEHTDVTDIMAIHDYTANGKDLQARYAEVSAGGGLPTNVWGDAEILLFALGARHHNQPIMLTEVGGLLMIPPETRRDELDTLYNIYGNVTSADEFAAQFEDILAGIASLKFISGFCFTQLTDVEQELNGLLTYDRQPKLPPAQIKAILDRLFS